MNFETLDYCARIQINAKALGGHIHGLSERHMEIYKNKTAPSMEEFVPETHTSEALGVRRDMCELIHRAYGNQLFTSDQGTFPASFRTAPLSSLLMPKTEIIWNPRILS